MNRTLPLVAMMCVGMLCTTDALSQSNDDLLAMLMETCERMDLPEQSTMCLEEILHHGSSSAMFYGRLGRLFERSGRVADAIRSYETLFEYQGEQSLYRLVVLHAGKNRNPFKAQEIYERIRFRFPGSPTDFAGRAAIRYATGDHAGAVACLDSGLARFPKNATLLLARAGCRSAERDSTRLLDELTLPEEITLKDIAVLLECGKNIRAQISRPFAVKFYEHVDRPGALFYPIKRQLAAAYAEVGAREDEQTCLSAICSLDSAYFVPLEGYTDPAPADRVVRSALGEITKRSLADAALLFDIGTSLVKLRRNARAKAVFTQYVNLPCIVADPQRTISANEEIVVLLYLENDREQCQSLARELLTSYGEAFAKDPFAFGLLIKRAICFYLLDDFSGAEAELRLHSKRANEVERRTAAATLAAFAGRGVNKPEVQAAIARYFGDVQPPLPAAPDTVSAAPLLARMALETFGETTKVNPEPDKAYVLVRSLVPMLRFDSNRAIFKVNPLSSGDWELWLPPGTHILKIDAQGYQRLELPPINFARRRSYEISVKKATEE